MLPLGLKDLPELNQVIFMPITLTMFSQPFKGKMKAVCYCTPLLEDPELSFYGASEASRPLMCLLGLVVPELEMVGLPALSPTLNVLHVLTLL